MDGLIKYGLRVLLFFGILLSGGCTNENLLSSDEEQVMVSLNFSFLDRASLRSTLDLLETNNNAESFLKTVRILVFSSSGEKMYNHLFSPGAYQNWTTQIYIKPGTYTFHAVANEAGSMTGHLNNVSDLDSFHNLSNLKEVKREDGMIMGGGDIVAFLMKGESENVEVSADLQTSVTIELKRLLAKVEMNFKLSDGQSGGFNSFLLGDFPRCFSYFNEGIYSASTDSGDNGRQWKVDNISTDQSYVYYIPPCTPKDNSPYLTFSFKWHIGGYQHSEKRDFRESDDSKNIYKVQSNYHYKYTIRLKESQQNLLEVQCTIAPWIVESEKEYYVDDCCNLKIEKDGEYIKFILQHVDQNPNFEFPKDRYYLEFMEKDGVVWDCYVNYNDETNEMRVGNSGIWDGNNRRYILPFKNNSQGKSVISIRYLGSKSPYGRCYFNKKHIYNLQN